MIAGALTAGELTLLRTRPQRTQLYLAIAKTHTIYVAQVNGTPASNDGIALLPFYNGGGGGTVLTNVKAGMLLCVGTFPGLWDIGMARIRKDAAGGDTSFRIGATSEIDFVGDYYLTVLDSYSIWPRHPYIDPATGIIYMDYGIVYNLGAPGLNVKQNEYGAPVIIMGSHAVLEKVGASVTTNFDAVGSYSCIGTPVSYTYAWSCVDVNATVVTPAGSNTNIAFSAAGTYVIDLTVTANYAGGYSASSTAHRYVIVHDAAHPLNKSFFLESCSGSYDNGGWSYRITMHADAGEVDVMDRSLAILVARDWYGATEQSIGPLVGRENVVCVGWVDGDSIKRSNDLSLVTFEIQGPAFWLGVQQGFPTGIDDTNAAPTDWLHIQALDPRKGIFSFLHWRSTATAVTDCYITADNHRLATTYTPADSLLEQLRAIAERVNAKAVCDRYGRLFCEIDTQFIAPASRTFPVVQTLVDRDWRDEINLERPEIPKVGQVDLSGVYYSGNIATSNAIFSLAPGHIPMHYGDKRKIERIALTDQAEANLLAGLWLGYYNNEYPHIDTPFSSNYRAADIAPRMFVQMNLAAADTPRQIVWTDALGVPTPKKLIPREVTFNYDSREALLLTDITLEAESFPSTAIVGDPPIEPPPPPPPPPPPVLCNDPDALNFGMIGDCIYPVEQGIVVVITANHIGRSLDFYTASPATDVHWDDISTGLPGGCGMYNLQIGGAKGWLIVTNAGSYDLYYCADLTITTPTWSLVLTTATARTYTNVWVGHNNQSMAVTAAGVCYLAAQLQAPSNLVRYWRCVNGAIAGYENVNVTPHSGSCTGAGPSNAACDDGVDVYLASESGSLWISPTLGTHLWDGGVIIRFYAVSSAHGISTGSNMYDFSRVFTRGDSFNLGQLTEMGGHTFYKRASDGFFMIDDTIQAVPNDADGGIGTFSAAGATGSHWFAFGTGGYGEILWVASSVAAANSKRSIAYTADGGITWETRDGNWAAVFGAWQGGTYSMIRTSSV